MAATTRPEPLDVPMPPDTLLVFQQRRVAEFITRILNGVAECEKGYAMADRVMDQLPDAMEAARSNPLSVDAAEQLHAFCEQLKSIADRLQLTTTKIRRARELGVNALGHLEARLEVVREQGSDVFGDESTAYTGEDVA